MPLSPLHIHVYIYNHCFSDFGTAIPIHVHVHPAFTECVKEVSRAHHHADYSRPESEHRSRDGPNSEEQSVILGC